MNGVADWSDVLNDHMIDAWPRVAEVLSEINCALMGGTGVAMLLRHRKSFDLDFVTLEPFDSRGTTARFLSAAKYAAYKEDDRDHIAKVAFDGVPVTLMRDLRGFVRGHARDIEIGPSVDGIRIGSFPDLMAMKLDVIRDRSQARDYIDICEMDRLGACRIEDGLRYHRQRYDPTVSWEETTQVAEMATNPPHLNPDPVFDERMPDVLDHLERRRGEVMRWAIQSAERPRASGVSEDTPTREISARHADAPAFSTPTADDVADDTGPADSTAGNRCNKWMPEAETACVLPEGHSGGCRSRYSRP